MWKSPATRNRTRDHLIAASFYSQMLYQLSYSRLVCERSWLVVGFILKAPWPEQWQFPPRKTYVPNVFVATVSARRGKAKSTQTLGNTVCGKVRPPGIEPGTI